MPKFKRKPVGPVAFIFLATFACGTLYMALSAPLVASFVLALLSLAFFLARRQTKRGEKQLRALAEMRAGESICEFAREFDIREVDSWIVRAVYEQIQGQLQHVHSSFPVRASDRLKEDLHLDDDDLDMDLAVQIEQRTGRSIDDTNANPYFGKVKTVRDLVLFFQFQPKQTVI